MRVLIVDPEEGHGPVLAVEYNWQGRPLVDGPGSCIVDGIRLHAGRAVRDLDVGQALELAHGILAIVKAKRQET